MLLLFLVLCLDFVMEIKKKEEKSYIFFSRSPFNLSLDMEEKKMIKTIMITAKRDKKGRECQYNKRANKIRYGKRITY